MGDLCPPSIQFNMDENKEKTISEEIVETPKPKKSELIKEQIALEKQYTTESNAMIEQTYSVKVGTKSSFDRLMKYIEHDAEFDHSTATGIALLFSNLKQQKPFTRDAEWNGSILLKTSSCLVLWKSLMSFKGKGFYEAKSFLETIQLIGPELSKAVNIIDEKNVALRGLHSRLNEIDNILDSGEFENDLTEEEEKALLEESASVIKTEQEIENEVNPEVNA